MAMRIHPTAIVAAGAELGDGVEVGPYAIIEDGVRLGPGTRVGPHVCLCRGLETGAACVIHMGAVVGNEPQHFSYRGEATRAVLGERVVVREHATIHRASGEGNETRIGDECYLMVGSHVAHNCVLGRNVILANGVLLAGFVRIGERANVSGHVVIHQFVRVGRLCMLSGGSRFGMDVPPYLIGDGTNYVTSLNTVGLRRCEDLSDEDRRQIKSAYRILYRSDLELPAALERLKAEYSSPAVAHWVEFFSQPSPRGFCHYRASRRASE